MATGEQEDSWGDILDANMTKLENAIANAGTHSSTGGTTTLTSDQARNAMLIFSGVLASDHTVVVPSHAKMWIVRNNHTLGSFALKFKTSGGTAVTVPKGDFPVNIVFCDGADIYIAGATEALIDTAITSAKSVFIGGSVAGTGNDITCTTDSTFAYTQGFMLVFVVGTDNSTTTNINVNALGQKAIFKADVTGPRSMQGKELQAGQIAACIYDGTQFQLLNPSHVLFGAIASLASDTTTDLGTMPTKNILITGTTTITGFGSTALVDAPLYFIRFDGALLLTHNATSLIIPGGANVTTAQGDSAIVEYLGSGNWRIRNYQKVDGKALVETDQIPAGTAGHLLASDGSGGAAFNGNSTVRARASISDGGSATCTVDAGDVNIASVTYSAGTYTVTFDTALASNAYQVFLQLTGSGGFTDTISYNVSRTTTGFTFFVARASTGGATTWSNFDLLVLGGW